MLLCKPSLLILLKSSYPSQSMRKRLLCIRSSNRVRAWLTIMTVRGPTARLLVLLRTPVDDNYT